MGQTHEAAPVVGHDTTCCHTNMSFSAALRLSLDAASRLASTRASHASGCATDTCSPLPCASTSHLRNHLSMPEAGTTQVHGDSEEPQNCASKHMHARTMGMRAHGTSFSGGVVPCEEVDVISWQGMQGHVKFFQRLQRRMQNVL